jgi:hypothetical protein
LSAWLESPNNTAHPWVKEQARAAMNEHLYGPLEVQLFSRLPEVLGVAGMALRLGGISADARGLLGARVLAHEQPLKEWAASIGEDRLWVMVRVAAEQMRLLQHHLDKAEFDLGRKPLAPRFAYEWVKLCRGRERLHELLLGAALGFQDPKPPHAWLNGLSQIDRSGAHLKAIIKAQGVDLGSDPWLERVSEVDPAAWWGL